MKRTAIILYIIAMLSSGGVISASADEPVLSGLYSGDFFTRSTLTGDWGGLRNDLAKKGVIFDMTMTQTGQAVTGGGKNSTWEYGGRGNLTLKVDTEKLGLWSGGFLTAELEGNFGRSANPKSGALSPVDANQMFPVPVLGKTAVNLPALNITQYLSSYIALVAGKMDTTGGDMNDFAHGKGDTQFMNLAFNLNPALLMTVPYSTLGAGVVLMPTKDPAGAIITVSALSAAGQPSTTGFNNLYSNQMTFNGEARVRTQFFGKTGHQLVGAIYSNKDFTSLDQRLGFVLETKEIAKKQGSWAVYYNFDQYLYEPEKGSGRGFGLFGRFAATDGNPNPIQYVWSLGFGGKGFFAGRPNDRAGIGYYYLKINQPDFNLPIATTQILGNEYGIEAFYTVALTPWLLLTPDIQVVRPSQRNRLELSTGPLPVVRKSIDTATILALRLQVVF